MRRGLRRQVLGQRRSLAARPKNIEDPVEHLADVHVARPTAAPRRRDHWLDQRPLRIRQIARVTQAAPCGGLPVFRRPHRVARSAPTPHPSDRSGNASRAVRRLAGVQASTSRTPPECFGCPTMNHKRFIRFNNFLDRLLEKLVDPRNHLMHANPISVCQAEQVICYSYDVIESIKARVEEMNMGQEYNSPKIIKISDSNGSVFHDAQINRNETRRGVVQVSDNSSMRLRAGEKLSIETEIDPSFSPDDYRVEWTYTNPAPEHIEHQGRRITIDLRECHVREDFAVYCKLISNQSWHRCGDCAASGPIGQIG